MQTIAIPSFSNEPITDFSDPKIGALDKINDALRDARERIIGKRCPLIIGGDEQFTEKVFLRENPSRIDETIGYICVAEPNDADKAIRCVRESEMMKRWICYSPSVRATYLKLIAQKFREKRFFFIALMILETGKSAPEADAEICEAIDFLEWYAVYAPFIEELGNKTLSNPGGEKNSSVYLAGGKVPICASIQPWNFPIAISVGPVAAALVSGYAVIYKPSEQSSVIGYHIVKTFLEAGLPKDLLHFLPGYGEKIGSCLVSHPGVSAIAFTGSKSVRNSIQQAVAWFNETELPLMSREDRYEKRAIALESGGKNAIIVDSDADIDEVVIGVSDSAFGFQGQKCSACSRLVIVDRDGVGGRVYGDIIGRLNDRIKSFLIGPPEDLKNKIGPLINKEAYDKFYKYVKLALEEGCSMRTDTRLRDTLGGYFVPPVLFENVHVNSRTAHEEVFGPMLAVFCVETFEKAILLANNTEFALTAGVYSRNPRHIDIAKRELSAGNIYVNHKITGAVVGRQPFGGFKMSGNGVKAGGWDYLLSFLSIRKNITENTMRSGIPLE